MTAKILIADKSDEIGVVCEKELKSLAMMWSCVIKTEILS